MKELRKLEDKPLERQVPEKLSGLERTADRQKRLNYGLKGYYRLRVGKLRISYTVQGSRAYVEVLVKDHNYGDA